MNLTGTYLTLALVCACLIVWPQQTQAVLTSVSLKIQVYILNYRMKFMAWRIYRTLCRDMKKHFGSEMPPFVWVDLWDRER